MPTYITKDAQGHITASADTDAWQCSEESKQRTIANLLEQGYALSLKPVVRGYDGWLYFEGEAPVKPAADASATRRIEIQRELDAIDLQSVRPLRAKLAGTATAEDEARLASLEAQAQTLRAELAGLPQ